MLASSDFGIAQVHVLACIIQYSLKLKCVIYTNLIIDIQPIQIQYIVKKKMQTIITLII